MSRFRAFTQLLLALTAVLAYFLTAAAVSAASPQPSESTGTPALPTVSCDYSVLTAHNDNLRTGAQTCETVLTPQTVPHVQKVAQAARIGKVTGQPLLLHGNLVNGVIQDALVVAANPISSTGPPSVPSVYFLNPATLETIFQIELPPHGYCSWPGDGCYGVHSTPVIDKAANILYVVAARKSNRESREYVLLAYDINSMTQIASAVISGTCGSGEDFNADLHRQRPALLLDHGQIYIAFGSANAEFGIPYNGWVFAYKKYFGRSVLARAGHGRPYCASRSVGANPWGRGGIWQLGAGMPADSEGNIYAATGNGQIDDPSQDDSQSYVKIGGERWTGGLLEKYQHPNSNRFLAPNELEGSSGPIVLPGPNRAQRILGATKVGLFTLLDASTMRPTQGPFRAAWHQYGPILGDPDPSLIEPDAVACTSPTCDERGIPSFRGNRTCCPSGCTETHACMDLIHGSHPHIHGQPCFLPNSANGGTVYWWGEKDYPRYMKWNSQQGMVVPVPGSSRLVDNLLNRVSNDSSDLAPPNPPTLGGSGFMMGGMPGGLMSLSANGTSNAVLWANIPQDAGCVLDKTFCSDRPDAQKAWLKAFDVSGSLPKKHILQIDPLSGEYRPDPSIVDGEYHAYPTIANGYVYLATREHVVAYSTRPPSNPTWKPVSSGRARAVGSAWVIGTTQVGNGDYGIYRWDPMTQTWPQVTGGGQTISVDLNGAPWIVNLAGQVFKWDGAKFDRFGDVDNFCATSVASGSTDTETWATRCGDDTIWHWTGSAWEQASGRALKVAVFSTPDPVCGDHLPVVLGTNKSIYFYVHSGGCMSGGFTYSSGVGHDISTDLAVGTDGNIHRWNPSTGWSFYVKAPWGSLDTKIGAWANGIFAVSTTSGVIQRVTPN